MKIQIEIPNRSLVWSFLTAIMIVYSWIMAKYFILPEIADLFDRMSIKEFGSAQIFLLAWLLIIGYCSVVMSVFCATNTFKKLKNDNEQGLVTGLLDGLVEGLIVGLIIGLLPSFFIIRPLTGLTLAIIVGVSYGLIFGLIKGLFNEFKR
jgi:hypothetical protein